MSSESKSHLPSWKNIVGKYQKSSNKKSIWQFINSFFPFIISLYLMYICIDISYWLSIVLALSSTGFFMFLFLVLYRFPNSRTESMHYYHNSSYFTSLAIAVIIGLIIWFI